MDMHPKLLSSNNDLFKNNKIVGCISFILKEIIDYMTLKSNDGNLICKLRLIKLRSNEFAEKIKRIKKVNI